jgi:hypothetical protein
MLAEFSIIYGNGRVEIFCFPERFALERARKESRFDGKLTLWQLLENRKVRRIEF